MEQINKELRSPLTDSQTGVDVQELFILSDVWRRYQPLYIHTRHTNALEAGRYSSEVCHFYLKFVAAPQMSAGAYF